MLSIVRKTRLVMSID
ncbi:hypothetical protein MTR67_051524 [Solanum verrucosum]|uniref:Uncharacterized protein n=1 Tax=Solanum verrucosum TaxID=315347 RepID=A0AAF0V6P4_SOLVR|nr:hypothetical protein MTR67_051524 [Solanum verrucosum]